jgi:Tol biopolymer transport system component
MSQAVPLFSQPDPPRCQTDAVHVSPDGQALILQYNCKTTLFARLFDLAEATTAPAATIAPTTLPQGYFMGWSPDSQWVLFRDIETDRVSLIPRAGGEGQPIPLPDRTYTAAFAPDGQTILYAGSPGLGFGSEIGILNLSDGSLTPWRTFPGQIVAHPAWSPDGNNLAYVLMPDTNIPFIVGELWLADIKTGAPHTYLAEVDAGRGYAPVWAPDSSNLTFVHRENPEDVRANIEPLALHSNLRQVEISSGAVVTLTHFVDSLVTEPVWSPTGEQLVFTADDTIWLWMPDAAPLPVSPPGVYRHAAWLSLE